MLAVDVNDCHIMVAMPRRHGGVAGMLVALGDADVAVSRIEPRGAETGIYRLTVGRPSRLAVRILEGIGCQVSSPSGWDDAESA